MRRLQRVFAGFGVDLGAGWDEAAYRTAAMADVEGWLAWHKPKPASVKSTAGSAATIGEDGSVKINQIIFVEREGQRKIVLGENGSTIKSIGSAARKEIAEAAETKVHLFLFVKVRENWSDDPERYREMGLSFPKK